MAKDGKSEITFMRGARSFTQGRFETVAREQFDDGWTPEEKDERPLETQVTIERARSILSHNDSPDVGFDSSINPYRGCEHGCVYCFARPTHSYLDLSPGLDFETKLFAKTNALERLREELANPGYVPQATAPHAKLRAMKALTDAGVPVGVMVAPVIPMITDMEMEHILEAAYEHGAREAGYTLLRLPHELKDVWREWLELYYPERAAHVMSLVQQMRGGRDYDSTFGSRMRGEGQFAELFEKRFEIARK